MEPEVSLVMPAWRPREDWLNAAVDSALDEPAASIELIVVDDGSDPPVAQLLDGVADPRLRVLRIDHAGPAAARDAGFAESRGDYVRFVDSDDVVAPGSTGELLTVARAGEPAIAYGSTLVCDRDLNPRHEAGSEIEGWAAEECVAGGFGAYVVSLLIPSDVARRAGTWAESGLGLSEDWDFVLRCLELAPVRRLDRVVTSYRRHDDSLSRGADVAAGANAARAVLDRYFQRNPERGGGPLERDSYLRLHLDRARAHAWHGERRPAARELAAAARRNPTAAGRAAARIGAERVRAAVPEPVLDRARLARARRLESAARRSDFVRGAAVVLHAVARKAGAKETEVDPAMSVATLERCVRYLARNYRLVTAADLVGAARGRAPGQPLPIALTFDDDLPSHADYALGVLARHGASATAFLCRPSEAFWWWDLQAASDAGSLPADGLPHVDPALVRAASERVPRAIGRVAKAIEDLPPGDRDEAAAALAALAAERRPVLDHAGIARLVEGGWEIGAHTPGHYLLPTLDDAALAEQLRRRALVPGDDELPSTLAYPHGKAGAREAAAARAAGYTAAFTGYPGVVGAEGETDPHLIGRLQPDPTSPGRFALSLARALAR
jgi:glycosyltransferase involved in cell wall biosynthesis/peptidoglycan/xylan/chitin deacetylase (PgdA/CDA1 family)